MSNIVDLTHPHEPISVARDMVEMSPGCKAAVAVLVREDGSLWFECCGHEQSYIVWALEKMKLQILSNDLIE